MSVLGLLALCVLEILSAPIARLVSGSARYATYFQIVFVCFAIQTVCHIPESYLLARKQSVLYSSLSTGILVCGLGLNILFIVFMKLGVLGIMLSMLMTRVLNGVVVFVVTLRGVRYSFSWEKLKAMAKFGLPLVPAAMGLFIINYSDRFFVQRFCSLKELGLYSLGYKFGMLLSVMIAGPILSIWNTQRFEIAKMHNAKQVFSRIFTYFCAVMIFAGLGVAVFIDETLQVMTASDFWGAAAVVPLILLSYVLYGMANFLNLGIMVTYKTKYIAYTHVPVAVVNILLNVVFISRYGVMGAAVSTVLSFLCLTMLTFAFSQKLYSVPFEYRRLFILFTFSATIFAFSRMIHAPFLISLVIKTLLMLLFPTALLMCGFFYKEERKQAIELLREGAFRLGIEKFQKDRSIR
jgi:O-antigen/teichoic acid export membrane protein